MTDQQRGADLGDEVAAIWTRVLDADAVEGTSNFFDVGGESLRAIRITALVREVVADDTVPLRLIFDEPVLDDYVDALRRFAS